MASHFTGMAETPEERELRVRKSTFRRIRTMVVIFGLVGVVRLFIKNPPPPKTPDYTQYKVRYVPGMLDAIPAAERSKMDPRLLARMIQADEEGRKGHIASTPSTNAMATHSYKASETPLASQTAAEKDRQFAYSYAKRRQAQIDFMEQEAIRNTDKTMLVQFASGGYLHVEKAQLSSRTCEIKFDRKLMAAVPSKLVENVRSNAADWVPALPKGYVSLKPARGIKIILQQQIANRITIPTIPLQ